MKSVEGHNQINGKMHQKLYAKKGSTYPLDLSKVSKSKKIHSTEKIL